MAMLNKAECWITEGQIIGDSTIVFTACGVETVSLGMYFGIKWVSCNNP